MRQRGRECHGSASGCLAGAHRRGTSFATSSRCENTTAVVPSDQGRFNLYATWPASISTKRSFAMAGLATYRQSFSSFFRSCALTRTFASRLKPRTLKYQIWARGGCARALVGSPRRVSGCSASAPHARLFARDIGLVEPGAVRRRPEHRSQTSRRARHDDQISCTHRVPSRYAWRYDRLGRPLLRRSVDREQGKRFDRKEI